jgi:hypothetical protein
MTALFQKIRRPERETLTEAYEVRAFRDEPEQPVSLDAASIQPVTPSEPRVLQEAKDRVLGHGEQRVVPDDCQFGDNDLCNAEI